MRPHFTSRTLAYCRQKDPIYFPRSTNYRRTTPHFFTRRSIPRKNEARVRYNLNYSEDKLPKKIKEANSYSCNIPGYKTSSPRILDNIQ